MDKIQINAIIFLYCVTAQRVTLNTEYPNSCMPGFGAILTCHVTDGYIPTQYVEFFDAQGYRVNSDCVVIDPRYIFTCDVNLGIFILNITSTTMTDNGNWTCSYGSITTIEYVDTVIPSSMNLTNDGTVATVQVCGSRDTLIQWMSSDRTVINDNGTYSIERMEGNSCVQSGTQTYQISTLTIVGPLNVTTCETISALKIQVEAYHKGYSTSACPNVDPLRQSSQFLDDNKSEKCPLQGWEIALICVGGACFLGIALGGGFYMYKFLI